MMTGILSRRREFAVLQAVGMTNRQLKTMLIYEGLFYAMSSVAAAFILSLAVGPLAGKMLGSMFWFFEYRFTILPVLLTITFTIISFIIRPRWMLHGNSKTSSFPVLQFKDSAIWFAWNTVCPSSHRSHIGNARKELFIPRSVPSVTNYVMRLIRC